MRHLQLSFSGNNAIWRYVVLIGAVFIAANTIGGIPLIIGFATRTVNDPAARCAENVPLRSLPSL